MDTKEFKGVKALLFTSGETEAGDVNLGRAAKLINSQRATVCGLCSDQRMWVY